MSDKQKFIRVFDVDDYQVAAICRGAGEKPDRYKFEQVTYFDGICVSATVRLPFEAYEKVLDLYDEDRAREFLNMMLAMFENATEGDSQ